MNRGGKYFVRSERVKVRTTSFPMIRNKENRTYLESLWCPLASNSLSIQDHILTKIHAPRNKETRCYVKQSTVEARPPNRTVGRLHTKRVQIKK